MVLPECDGDVSILEGRHYVEAPRCERYGRRHALRRRRDAGETPRESVQIALPYVSGAVVPGATYAVIVDVFAADGFARLAGSAGNIPVDRAAAEAVVQFAPVSP
jgi:hypothetical protein